MGKTVVINVGQGNLQMGFPHIVVRLWTDLNPRAEQFIGTLPAAPEVIAAYQNWRSVYNGLSNRLMLRQPPVALEPEQDLDDGLEIEEGGVTNISLPDFDACSQEIKRLVNQWLASAGLQNAERQLRSHLHPTDEIRVIIETDDEIMLRLPWHCWQFFEDYPRAEMALSRPEYQRQAMANARSERETVRILAIVGDRRGIDIEPEREALQGLADAEVEFLVTPSRQAFDQALWHSAGWDILFFAGHSRTEQETGRIYINEQSSHNSLTIKQLEAALKGAIAHGLKLAIFNSCDGVGLAQALGDLQIPQVIVMREPVPNRVAQEFLRNFLDAFAQRQLPLYPAMRQARQRLQGLEDEFPGASWLPVLCQNPAVEPLTWIQLRGMSPCPYRGLAAFQEADAPLFFGREQVTTDLLTRVKRKAMVAVVGPSGSGKSSVVFAGLVPRLRQTAGSMSWHILSCRPGAKPFDALAKAWLEYDELGQGQAFVPIDNIEEDQSFRLRVLELAVDLQHERQMLSQMIDRHHHDRPATRLLLIIDQFEELYTLCPEADRQPFLDGLLDAVQSIPAFTLVLTLRADFYGYALSDRRFSDALQSAVYNLGPMNRRELEEAIAQPAAKMQVQLESGLTDKLIQATWDHAGRLPLLEFALTELWANQVAGWLTHGAYEAIGGVEEALANHAELIYAQLTSVDQQRMQRVFVQLVEPGVGTSSTRRLATQDEVGEKNWDLVSHLASKRLVVTNRDETNGDETVEIVHEALIVGWGRLGEWLQQDGEFRRWQEELRRSRRLWEKGDREDDALLRGKRLADAIDWYGRRLGELSISDRNFIQSSVLLQERNEKKRKRGQQLVVAALTTGLLAALGLSGIAWRGWQVATLNEIQALTTSSKNLLIAKQPFDALISILIASKKINGSLARLTSSNFKNKNDIQKQISSILQETIYKVREYNRLERHNSEVRDVEFSPDGQIIATASRDKTAILWKNNGEKIASLIGHKALIHSVKFSPDGQTIATASWDTTIKLWGLEGHNYQTLEGHTEAVYSVTFSPDGKTIATASSDSTIKLWRKNNEDGKFYIFKTLQEHYSGVNSITFSPDGHMIISGSNDGTVILWDKDGTKINSTQVLPNQDGDYIDGDHGVWDIDVSPDNRVIAIGCSNRTIQLLYLDKFELKIFSSHEDRVTSVNFSPDGKTLASGSSDKTIQLWSLDGSKLHTLIGHNDWVWGVSFSPDGQNLASASKDSTVKLWQVNGKRLSIVSAHTSAIYSVNFNSDGEMLATASQDKTVKLWNQSGELLKSLTDYASGVTSISFSPNGKIIATATGDKVVKIWTKDGEPFQTIDAHEGWIWGIDFSPDSRLMATVSADVTNYTVKLWSLDETGQKFKLFKTLRAHTDKVNSVRFSPNGQIIATSSWDKKTIIWNRNGDRIQTLDGHKDGVHSVRFSPDGKMLATASEDKSIIIWKNNYQKNQFDRFKTLNGHDAGVFSIDFSPNSQVLASGSLDNTVKIWSIDGQEIKTLTGHGDKVFSVNFSPSGKKLASSDKSGKLILWELALTPHDLTEIGCSILRGYLESNPHVDERAQNLCK